MEGSGLRTPLRGLARFCRLLAAVCGLTGFAAAGALGAPVSASASAPAGTIEILHPWTSPTPAGAHEAPGYLTVINHSTVAVRLIGVSLPAVERIELRVSGPDGAPDPVDGFAIGPGQRLELRPGGPQFALIGLKRTFHSGQHIPAILRFRNAGSVLIQFKVEGPEPHAAVRRRVTARRGKGRRHAHVRHHAKSRHAKSCHAKSRRHVTHAGRRHRRR